MKAARVAAPSRRASPVSQLRRSGSPATYGLIGITVLCFLVQLIPDLGFTEAMWYAGLYSFPTNFEPWRMITSMFVHSTGMVLHILLNMYTLWIFGRLLEPFLGTRRFVTMYLLAGWAGSVGVLWFGSPGIAVVGASGAIFGVNGAFIVIHRSGGGSSPQLYVLLGLNLVIGFLPGTAIAWQAHLGGLAVGALIGWVFARTRRVDQQPLQLRALIGIGVLLAVLSLRFVVFGA